jgi:hypothetical protein
VTVKGRGGDDEPVKSPDKAKVLAAARAVRKLNDLTMENVQLDVDDLAAISRLPDLRHLSLTNCGLTDRHMAALTLEKNVNFLVLRRNPIGTLPAIRHAWAIQVLDVSNTNVGDLALARLLDGAINLYALNLTGTAITDAVMDMLRPGQVVFDNVQLVGTNVSVDGVKRLLGRMQPNFVIMRRQEERQAEVKAFLKEKNIGCCVVMTDNVYFGGRKQDDKPILIGEPKKTHIIDDGTVIHARPGEFVTAEPSPNMFKKKN